MNRFPSARTLKELRRRRIPLVFDGIDSVIRTVQFKAGRALVGAVAGIGIDVDGKRHGSILRRAVRINSQVVHSRWQAESMNLSELEESVNTAAFSVTFHNQNKILLS